MGKKFDINQQELFDGQGNRLDYHEGNRPRIHQGERFLIDGSNVISVRGKRQSNLNVLLTLLSHIKKSKRDFHCIFDANANYTLRENAGGKQAEEVFLDLLTKYPTHFTKAPARMRADELLLQQAHQTQKRIVTNDLFDDFVRTYPWLENADGWLIKFAVVDNDLQVPAIKIMANCGNDLKKLIQELDSLLV
jgi:Zc3h12a-like Ribonuclease NYN domain